MSGIMYDVPSLYSLLVSWKPIPADCSNGILRGYRLSLQKSCQPNETVTKNIAPDMTYTVMYNLDISANYCLGVAEVTGKGSGNLTMGFLPADLTGELF